ncbi:MAG: hypothetical protein ACK58T_47785, partial [Phycisphaerae bacterium]
NSALNLQSTVIVQAHEFLDDSLVDQVNSLLIKGNRRILTRYDPCNLNPKRGDFPVKVRDSTF